MVICRPACRLVEPYFILLRGVVNWWMRTSQTSSSLARRRMNFWVLSFCQVTVILLSFVTVASKFLEDKEWFKFGVVMTFCHYVILGTYCDILIEFSCNLYCSGVQKA
jgi:hypothetical protein